MNHIKITIKKFPRITYVLRMVLRISRRLASLRYRVTNQEYVFHPATKFNQLISVVIPNYNHGQFLAERIDSVLNQTYRNFEIIILDDCSTDNSLEIINDYQRRFPSLIKVMANEKNSGNIFRQWRKGISAASGAFIWICESDDFVEPDFLEHLLPALADESVMIAFGRIQFATADGTPYEGLDAYRERAEPGIWSKKIARPAKAWFHGAFGASNVIANVGGCLIRNQPVEDEIWKVAETFKILGDWYLYLMLSRGGKIAYAPESVSYFRQHKANTSVSSFVSAGYYEEHERLVGFLRQQWGIPAETVARFQKNLAEHFQYSKASDTLGSFSSVFDTDKALAMEKGNSHILIVILGFYLGGGEIFPIHLANNLVKRGYRVSMMTLISKDWDIGVRMQLDHRFPVYDAEEVRVRGANVFIRETGIDLIHTHFVGAESRFLMEAGYFPEIPYVVTLHGSYECTQLDSGFIETVADRVSHWVYLSKKNLDHLTLLPADTREAVSKSHIPNGMPIDDEPYPQSRAELGIGEDDFVFVLVSRAIPQKGWSVSIRALELAQKSSPDCRLVLLLAGNGEEEARLRKLHASNDNVRFLGFQTRIHGLYRLGDCALLPTRFPGESYPLSLIQAMQVSRPVIATDIGEISSMVMQPGEQAGIVVSYSDDTDIFVRSVSEAMLKIMDEDTHSKLKRGAELAADRYSMDRVGSDYIECYQTVISAMQSARPARPQNIFDSWLRKLTQDPVA